MADTGFTGDPYHNSPARPLAHLQGGMESAPTQMPMDSTAMTNPRSAAADNIDGSWTASLAPTPAPTGNNDKAKAH